MIECYKTGAHKNSRRNRLMKKIFALLLVSCLLLGSLLCFSGCATRVEYDNAEAYTAGDFEIKETIHSVEIHWEGKYVMVSGHALSTIKAEDDYDGDKEVSLHYLVEDGVLKIHPCASGETVDGLEKSLLLYLPIDVANNLRKLEINVTGETNVELLMMKPAELIVNAEDGDINFDSHALNKVRIKTEKGSFKAKSVSVSELEFVSETGDAQLFLHLYGFTAVMRNEDGTFSSPDYEATENGAIYTYGTQDPALVFDTAGKVILKENRSIQ